MAFEKGKSGNPNGRPTKVDQALRGMKDTDVSALLRKLKRASPKAVDLIINSLDNGKITELQKLKLAKEICDMLVKVATVDKQLRKEDDSGSSPLDTEDDEDKPQQVIFKIV